MTCQPRHRTLRWLRGQYRCAVCEEPATVTFDGAAVTPEAPADTPKAVNVTITNDPPPPLIVICRDPYGGGMRA